MGTKPVKVLYMASLVPSASELMNIFKNNYAVNNKPERKRKNLIRLGIESVMAYQWSRSRMGGWAIAQSPILRTTVTIGRLCKRGYESMLSYYEKVAPHLNEPLYTNGEALSNALKINYDMSKPVRTMVCKAHSVS